MTASSTISRSVALDDQIRTQWQVQAFVFAEAALLDAWDLNAWFQLFAKDGRYEVAPTGVNDGFNLPADNAFFYVVDDHQRLEQRVLRLQKPNAHVEYPHSRTRHLYSNIRVIADDGATVEAMVNFATYRTKHSETHVYPGSIHYRLRRQGESYQIAYKRIVLDLDALIPQGKLSIIL